MDYNISTVSDSIENSIRSVIQLMCKENNINYIKQDYHILFSNEDILFKNNDVRFTSGLKKYLCFYGRLYSNKNCKIVESVHTKDSIVSFEPETNDLLVISGGVDNSTYVEEDQTLTHFYIASKTRLGMHDPKTWKTL